MQGQDTQKDNVVSLFAERKKAEAKPDVETGATSSPNPSEESFEDIVARNLKNQERMAKERASANKSVLRSYRIKH